MTYYTRKIKRSQKRKMPLQKRFYYGVFTYGTLLIMAFSVLIRSAYVFYFCEFVLVATIIFFKTASKSQAKNAYNQSGLQRIDTMSDADFRRFIWWLWKGKYKHVDECADATIDYIVTDNRKEYAVVVKRTALQLDMRFISDCVYAATALGYPCRIVTNGYPTQQARLLALHCGAEIIDRTALAEQVSSDEVLKFINSSFYQDDKRCPYCGERLMLNKAQTRYICKNRPKCKFSYK